MDIQTGLLCVAVAVVSAIVIYVILTSTMKEKTYDEAMADLRKKTEKEFIQGRAAKDKTKDKKEKKKAGKKVKEKNANSAGKGSDEQSDVDGSGKTHVVFVQPEAAVLDENVVVEEKKKKKKDKPILLNKNDPNFVAEKPVPIQNHFEKIQPKDDFELKRSHSREEIVKNSFETVPAPVVAAKEQNTQKQNKQNSKNSSASNKVAAVEQKVEKQLQQQQPPSHAKQNQSKQQKQAEKNTQTKTVDKSGGSSTVNMTIPNNVAPPAAIADVKEVAVTKQNNVKQQQAVPVKQPAAVLENNSPTPVISQQHSQNNEKLTASPVVKISKKKKSELAALNQISGDREGVNVNLLMPLVRKAELSKSEIQLLIDFLLNKQQGISDGSSEWIEGRQDPVLKLKKQLVEKEKALADEVEASAGFQARLKELRTELNAEKHNVRTLEEAIHTKQGEMASFALKLQHAVEEKQALGQQIQQLQTKLGEERLLIRKLQEEGAQAQNAFQQELLTQRQQLELHIAHLGETQHQQQETITNLEARLSSEMQEREALAGELALLQDRTSHLQDTAAQAPELVRQVEELRTVRAKLEHLVTGAQFETGRLQTEVSELSEQLTLLRGENEKLNNAIQTLQNDNSRLREANERLTLQVSSASVEARQLRDENESLAAQVTASMERPATEGRENGDTNNYSENKLLHIEDQDNLQKKEVMLEELSNQLKAKEIQVENLTSEVNSYKTEILEQQRLVLSLRDDVVKHQKEAERLTNDLIQQKSQIAKLIEQLDSQKLKNDELRTKNWKAMEALSSTEKLLQNKMNESDKLVNEAVKSAAEKILLEQQSSTRQLLQRVFPELVVPECKGQQELFEQVEKALKNWKPQQSDNNQSLGLVELEEQNSQLQTWVAHYKNIITDTEGMLNRLQSQIEQEEGKWGDKLQALQSQLEAVTRERDALQQSGSGSSLQRATNGINCVDTASQTSSKHRRFTGWLRKRLGLTKLKKSSKKSKTRHDSV